MKRYIQQWLLVVFALLQCASPLVHAHADGMNADDTPYAHGVSSAHELYPHTGSARNAVSHVERHLGAVVVMPHAIPASDGPSVGAEPVEHVSRVQPPDVADIAAGFNLFSSSSVVFPPRYASVWSQAPPVITPSAR